MDRASFYCLDSLKFQNEQNTKLVLNLSATDFSWSLMLGTLAKNVFTDMILRPFERREFLAAPRYQIRYILCVGSAKNTFTDIPN